MAGRNHSDEFKTEVLEFYEREGLNEAVKQYRVGKHTIYRWAEEAGLDTDGIRLSVGERNALAAASSNAKQAKERAAARERVVTRLLKTTEVALARELEILVAGGFTRDDLQALTNSRMKAIQQFELLEGRATSRQDFGLESVLAGVAIAFQAVLALVGDEALKDAMRETFALQLREIQEKGIDAMPELPSGDDEDIEDGEFEPVADDSPESEA